MSLKRLFTTDSVLPQDRSLVREQKGLIAPETWSLETRDAFREALYPDAPEQKAAKEENTLPSWLWVHHAKGKKTAPETSVLEIFSRIAGAATYRGWKLGLWSGEGEASAFYDEVYALLFTRRLVFSPKDMARLGLDWAYGATPAPKEFTKPFSQPNSSHLLLQNETIDSIVGAGAGTACSKWLRFLEGSQKRDAASITFIDTLTEWEVLPTPQNAPRASLNLMAFRHEDGSLDVGGLEQATHLAILLLDLCYDEMTDTNSPARPLALGFGGMADLLISLGIAYDSEKGRSTASALAALISAQATLTSAYLANKFGPCAAFSENREAMLRNLENRIRAAFGEKTDYDRLSVLPRTLEIDSGVNLILLSAARHACEKALDHVRAYGLRHLQLTSLFCDPSFAIITGTFSQGVEPMASLVCDAWQSEEETFERQLAPAILLGLSQLGYDYADAKAARNHVLGYRTLVGAPGIGHADLKDKGFDEEALEKLEAALSFADSLRLAFTPWVLGDDFCRKKLKISAKDLKDPAFDLLKHLGFSAKEISLAENFCCGWRNLRSLHEIRENDKAVFATREDVSPEAMIRMAAAVQSFITGDVHLALPVPASVTAQVRGELSLMSWRQGLRGITLSTLGQPLGSNQEKPTGHIMKRKTSTTTTQHATTQGREKLPTPASQFYKAPARVLTINRSKNKASLKEKRG